MTTPKTISLALGALALVVALAGCAALAPAAEEPTTAADALTVTDAWAKASDEGTSAAFGILENTGDTELTIVSAATEAAGRPELHETVESATGEMVMQPKPGGFVIPAGATYELAPGGNHIMLMELTGPMAAGQEVTLVLTLSDGSTFEFRAPVKDYQGANETYVGDMDMGGN